MLLLLCDPQKNHVPITFAKISTFNILIGEAFQQPKNVVECG